MSARDPLFDPRLAFELGRPSPELRERILDDGWFPARGQREILGKVEVSWEWICDGCGRAVEVRDRGFPRGWTFVPAGHKGGVDVVTHRCATCSPAEERAQRPRDSYAEDTPVDVRGPTIAIAPAGGRVATCPSPLPASGDSGSRSP